MGGGFEGLDWGYSHDMLVGKHGHAGGDGVKAVQVVGDHEDRKAKAA